MGFAEFDVCLLDSADNPGVVFEMRANTDDPVRGDWIDVDGKSCRVVEVRHIEDPNERPPKIRTRCYVREEVPPTFFKRATESRLGITALRPVVGKLVSLPSSMPTLIGVGEEKRVRSAGSANPHTATTVQRALSMSQVERSLSEMKTAQFAPGSVVIPSGGAVVEAVVDRPQLPIPGSVNQNTVRFFVAEAGAGTDRPTLRLLAPPSTATDSRPTIPERPALVIRARRRNVLVATAVLLSAIGLLAAGLIFRRGQRVAPTETIAAPQPQPAPAQPVPATAVESKPSSPAPIAELPTIAPPRPIPAERRQKRKHAPPKSLGGIRLDDSPLIPTQTEAN